MHGQALHKLVGGLVRRTWVFAVMATLACAAFAASAVAALVEASYLSPSAEAASLPAVPKPSQAAPVKKTPDGSALVERDIFCSSCTPAVDITGPADVFVPQAILIATSVGLDPRATIRVPASEAQGSYGIGDAIPGVGKVDRIGWRSVDVLDAGGRRGRLDLLGPGGGAVSGGAATPDTTAAADPILSRIKKIDDHTFEVDRELVRDLVSGAVKPGGMRILPLSGKDGKLEGLRVFGVKDTALAGLVGLKNGDIMTAINNNQIKNAQSLLDVYTQLDTLNTVEIDGKRGDKPLALTLRLK